MGRYFNISFIPLVCMFVFLSIPAPCRGVELLWWDDFDQYDGTYNFGDWYQRNPTGNFWHVTEKTSAFTRRLSGDCSLWYGSEHTGNYADDIDECAAIITIPINSGGTPGGDDRDIVVQFWQWVETEGVYGRDFCSVYFDCNDGNWVRLYRSYNVKPGWKHNTCESFIIPAVSQFRIKFEFNTNGSTENHFGGWYIDELYIWSQPIDTRRGTNFRELSADHLLLRYQDKPGPQRFINTVLTENLDPKHSQDKQLDKSVAAVPSSSWAGLIALLVIIGVVIIRSKGKIVLCIAFIIFANYQLTKAYPSLITQRISPSDALYDGRPSIGASDNWGFVVWEKEIRNTTKLMCSYWAQEGDTWTDEGILETGNLISLRHPDVARDEDNPDVFWVTFEGVDTNGIRNIYAGKADFSLWTWNYSQVNSGSFDACVSPVINGDTNNKRVAFVGISGNNFIVYASEWNGSGWASQIQASDSAHSFCAEPSLSHSYLVYSGVDTYGNREIFLRYNNFNTWLGTTLISSPADPIPEIHPVIKYYPGSSSRTFVIWIKDNQGNSETLSFRDAINGVWNPTQILQDSFADFDMAYEADNQSVVMLVEKKTFDHWQNHRMQYVKRDFRTPTPGFTVYDVGPNDTYPPYAYCHRMDISMCDLRDGYSLFVWSGSPRNLSPPDNDLTDRSIVFSYVDEFLPAFTPAPTHTPVYQTVTPLPPTQSNYTWCHNDPSLPLNDFSYDYNQDAQIDYGHAPDPIMFSFRSLTMTTRSWVVHGWDDVLLDTDCVGFMKGQQFWFSFIPDSAISKGIAVPIDVSERVYSFGPPGTATPTPPYCTPTPYTPPPSTPPTPIPTCTAAPNPSLGPYISIAPWIYSPSRKGVLRFRMSIPPNCSGPPGNIEMKHDDLSSFLLIAQTTDWVWNSSDNKWEFLWDGLYQDGQGNLVCSPNGHCYLKINPGSNWFNFVTYRTSITIE